MADELVTLNRRVAGKALLEDHECCLLDGVDMLTRTVTKRVTAYVSTVTNIEKYFKVNSLRLLQANKEGGFVVVPEEIYEEKACCAVAQLRRTLTQVI